MPDRDQTDGLHNIRLGCAGWSIPRAQATAFGIGPSHLMRYATHLSAVEIDSTFYRSPRPATYRRWAASVPSGFQFAVKVPRTVTHQHRLLDPNLLLDTFLAECRELGPALGPLLLQLPPSLAFDVTVVEAFLASLRTRFAGPVVCEPRHASWFTGAGDALLAAYQTARVAADPAIVPPAVHPGGWNGLVYYRLHGAPRVYYSAYDAQALDTLADQLRQAVRRGPAWCIFDNTAAGAATANALELLGRLRGG